MLTLALYHHFRASGRFFDFLKIFWSVFGYTFSAFLEYLGVVFEGIWGVFGTLFSGIGTFGTLFYFDGIRLLGSCS